MYDIFSVDYDRFVNWPARLEVEIPFIEQLLRRVNAQQVLDAACGTGMHALALAQHGYKVSGADLSAGMIGRARANASAAETVVGVGHASRYEGFSCPRFETAGFGELAHTFGRAAFDALLCLGNSLPHLLTPAELTASLVDFAACLRPGGLLLIQNRNFDAVLAQHERWMEPQSYREGNKEWLFLRFYDFEQGVFGSSPLLTFNILTLQREGLNNWQQQVTQTHLYPLRQVELSRALSTAGFIDLEFYGNMSGAPFNPDTSGNLIVTGVTT